MKEWMIQNWQLTMTLIFVIGFLFGEFNAYHRNHMTTQDAFMKQGGV